MFNHQKQIEPMNFDHWFDAVDIIDTFLKIIEHSTN